MDFVYHAQILIAFVIVSRGKYCLGKYCLLTQAKARPSAVRTKAGAYVQERKKLCPCYRLGHATLALASVAFHSGFVRLHGIGLG